MSPSPSPSSPPPPAGRPQRAPWQPWVMVLGAVVVGCVLVASRIKPIALIGTAIVVIALLILLRMSIEAFGRRR